MIAGLSAIHNIGTVPVNEPHIRATLKYNSFMAGSWQSPSDVTIYEDMKTIQFNQFYITYDNFSDLATFQNIVTYDSGGSVWLLEMVSAGNINGVSWNDNTYLRRGDFFVDGSTLNLYFIKTGATLTNRNISKICRMSTKDGLTWGGFTVMNTTIQGTSNCYEYDIAVGRSFSFYTMAFDKNHDSIHWGTIGVSQTQMYTDLYGASQSDKRIELIEFDNSRFLVLESGEKFTIKAQPNTQSSYADRIRLLNIGITSVFNETVIARSDSGANRLKLVYGGVLPTNDYGYFGIIKNNNELVTYAGDSGTYESLLTHDYINTVYKIDTNGNLYSRVVLTNGQGMDSLVVGATTSTQELTFIITAGEFSSIWYPMFESYGASVNISGDISSYTNIENRRISLELGNVK